MTSSSSAVSDELASLHARVRHCESEIVRRDALLEQHAATIERLQEQVRLLLAKRFAASSEKLPDGQLGLFNEAEATAAEDPESDSGTEVAAHRRARAKRALELAGQIGDGAFMMGGPPGFVKIKIDKIRQAAEKAGRDPDTVDIVTRTWIYPCESREKARKEVSGCLTQHCGLPSLNLEDPDPETRRLLRNLEDREPGILAEIRKARDLWQPKYHEHSDGPHALVTTQRMIDLIHLTGREEDILEGLSKLYEAGVRTVAPGTYSIVDKKGLLQEIGSKILPHFRN